MGHIDRSTRKPMPKPKTICHVKGYRVVIEWWKLQTKEYIRLREATAWVECTNMGIRAGVAQSTLSPEQENINLTSSKSQPPPPSERAYREIKGNLKTRLLTRPQILYHTGNCSR
jgi:hypothetical protein